MTRHQLAEGGTRVGRNPHQFPMLGGEHRSFFEACAPRSLLSATYRFLKPVHLAVWTVNMAPLPPCKLPMPRKAEALTRTGAANASLTMNWKNPQGTWSLVFLLGCLGNNQWWNSLVEQVARVGCTANAQRRTFSLDLATGWHPNHIPLGNWLI